MPNDDVPRYLDVLRARQSAGDRSESDQSNHDACVILVRHGRTAFNAAGLLRGRLDPPLDATGEIEANALGAIFQGCRFQVVVTSPLKRAKQTAAAIAQASHCPVEVDHELADRNYGPWAGSAPAEVIERFGSIDVAPGVEPMAIFTHRVTTAVRSAAERAAPEPIVVVAHDAVNRVVLCQLVPSLGDPSELLQPTGRWNCLERRGDLWSAPVVGARPPRSRDPVSRST